MATKYINESTDIPEFFEGIDEPQGILSFVQGYEKIPLISLEKAINPLVSLVPELEQMMRTVKNPRNTPKDGLTNDESVSISLYSIEWKPRDKSFYVILNTTLQTANRILLEPWFPYLKLIMTALTKLPSNSTRLTVYHAVKLNLVAQYPLGRTFIWWGFTMCTMSLDALNNENIFGQNGPRTLFIIDCQSGKSIRQHSFYPKEEDVLLPPICQFQVMSCLDSGNGLHIIHLKELPPKYQLINPVSLPPIISSTAKLAAPFPKKSNLVIPGSPKLSTALPRLRISFNENLPKRQSIIKPNQSTPIKHKTTSLKPNNPKVSQYIDALYSDPTLITLDLSRSQINDQEVRNLANALQQNKTLITLNLHHNLIGSQGAQYLADALKQNTTLTTLNMEGNQIGDQGAEHFANVLQKNKSLTILNLRANQIKHQGAEHLANALQQNKTLITINLRSNLIGNPGVHHLANALQQNQTLTTLELQSNRIGPPGAQYLANALQLNKTLTTLDLESNQIGLQGAQYFANALQQNKTLTTLNLEGNQIDNKGKQRIKGILKNNPTLNIAL